MARKSRGFLGRLFDGLKDFFGDSSIGKPTETPKRHPPRQPPPPARPPPGRGAPPIQDAQAAHERRMQQIFVQVTGGTTGYLDWRDLWVQYESLYDTPRQEERYWKEYLQAFYLTSAETGSVPRREFYNDSGIPESAIDWAAWREMKRGTP